MGFTAGLSVGKSGLTYKQCFQASHLILTMKGYYFKKIAEKLFIVPLISLPEHSFYQNRMGKN